MHRLQVAVLCTHESNEHIKKNRLLLCGTLDEKIYQRQLLKGDVAQAMMGAAGAAAKFTRDELRELFTLHEDTDCATRDLLPDTFFKV